MDTVQFREMEKRFGQLKERLEKSEISADDFKRELKKLVVLDSSGFYWMLGSKSGNWFRYNGREWIQESPYKEEESAESAIAPDQTQPLMRSEEKQPLTEPVSSIKPEPAVPAADTVRPVEKRPAVPCPHCRRDNEPGTQFCAWCGKSMTQKHTPVAPVSATGQDEHYLIKNISVPSALYFGGGMGLILGIVFGALFGVLNILPSLLAELPLLLQQAHGKLQGGLIFGAAGGLLGFVFFALLAVFQALFFNFITGIFGSVRITVRKKSAK